MADKKKDVSQFDSRIDELFETSSPLSFSDMVEQICMNYLFNRNWSINMVGVSGVGKNAIIKKATEVMSSVYPNFEFILFSGLSMLPEDVGGMPGYGRTLKGKSREDYDGPDAIKDILYDFTSSKLTYDYYLFNHIEKAFDPEWKGFLFVDEIAACEEDTKRKIYQFVYDRELNGKKLSPGCMVVFAMNPPSLAEYNLQPMPKPFVDRMLHYVVTATVTDWLSYAKKDEKSYDIMRARVRTMAAKSLPECDSNGRDHHHGVIGYVEKNPSIFTEFYARRLTHLSDCITAFEKYAGKPASYFIKNSTAETEHMYRVLMYVTTAALVPKEATEFLSFLGTCDPITAKTYLTGETKLSEVRKYLTSGDKASIITKINNDICEIVKEQGKGLFPDLETNGHLQDQEKVHYVNNRFYDYLELLVEEAPDTAVAFLSEASKYFAAWPELHTEQTKEKPENKKHHATMLTIYRLIGLQVDDVIEKSNQVDSAAKKSKSSKKEPKAMAGAE